MHERLAAWKEQLEAFGPASFIADPELNLVWVSQQLRGFLDEDDDAKIGIGKPMIDAWMSETWMRIATPETQVEIFLVMAPFLLWEYQRRGIPVPKVAEPFGELFESIEPRETPDLITWGFDYVDPRDPSVSPYRTNTLIVAIRDTDGSELGFVGVGNIALRPDLLALLARGNIDTYERMAKLIQPGPRQAAILFCDLHASGELSRRLSSAAYFDLIRRLWTAIDGAVAANKGIIGKHAGDGASAFFLVEDLGSPSAAASAAIKTAQAIHELSAQTFAEALDSPCVMRVGLHWGGTLYMGQLVPGGRLDVTALGDEVNECARIEECAGPDETLASKRLLEQLSAADAAALDLDLGGTVYNTIAETSGASEKARRDAGSIPLARI